MDNTERMERTQELEAEVERLKAEDAKRTVEVVALRDSVQRECITRLGLHELSPEQIEKHVEFIEAQQKAERVPELKAEVARLRGALEGAIRVIDFAKVNSKPVDAELYFEASRVARLAFQPQSELQEPTS